LNSMNHDDELQIVFDDNEEDYKTVCNNLYNYNFKETNGLLTKPGRSINLFMKDKSGKAVGGIFCATYCETLYIDNFWIDEEHRKKGYGKSLIMQAESMASELGCKLAYTSTFSYQSPEFYQKVGYKVFGLIDDGIIQYFF
jgi:GNAT superfamily N-acetyltransferase